MPADLIADFQELVDDQKLLLICIMQSFTCRVSRFVCSILVKHRNHPFVDDLVFSAFDQFYVYVVNPLCATYNSSSLGVIGSIGFEFYNVIKRVAEHHGKRTPYSNSISNRCTC